MTEAQRKYIEALYNALYDNMLSYAGSSLASEELAEEAVQEAFRVACQKPDQLCASANPRGWMIQTLKYIIRNIKAGQNAAAQCLEKYILVKGDSLRDTNECLDLRVLYGDIVDTEDFRLLSEMLFEGRSYLEMAASRGISVDACRKRVQRARENLREKLQI